MSDWLLLLYVLLQLSYNVVIWKISKSLKADLKTQKKILITGIKNPLFAKRNLKKMLEGDKI